MSQFHAKLYHPTMAADSSPYNTVKFFQSNTIQVGLVVISAIQLYVRKDSAADTLLNSSGVAMSSAPASKKCIVTMPLRWFCDPNA